MSQKQTAVLREARIYGDFANCPGYLLGRVYGHPRFKDGSPVRTSRINRRIFDVVETENTIYEVHWAPETLTCEAHVDLVCKQPA